LSVISVNVFVKPLLDALGEQNRNLQVIWAASQSSHLWSDHVLLPHCS
jgi:hypothetical protein